MSVKEELEGVDIDVSGNERSDESSRASTTQPPRRQFMVPWDGCTGTARDSTQTAKSFNRAVDRRRCEKTIVVGM